MEVEYREESTPRRSGSHVVSYMYGQCKDIDYALTGKPMVPANRKTWKFSSMQLQWI